MSLGERIAKARNEKGLSQAVLGSMLNVGQTTVQGWEADRNEPGIDKLIDLCGQLNTNPVWVAFGDQVFDDLRREFAPHIAGYLAVPYNNIGAGVGGPRLPDEADPNESILLPEAVVKHEIRALPEHLIAFPVHGQSMSPSLPDGTVVVADMRKKTIGGGGLFGINDGDGFIVKWVEKVRGSDPPLLRFISENKNISPYERMAEEAGIVGLIVWSMGRVG